MKDKAITPRKLSLGELRVSIPDDLAGEYWLKVQRLKDAAEHIDNKKYYAIGMGLEVILIAEQSTPIELRDYIDGAVSDLAELFKTHIGDFLYKQHNFNDYFK